MRYEEFPVEPELRHLVVNFWLFATDERDPPRFEHTIVPDGTSAISIVRNRPWWTGAIGVMRVKKRADLLGDGVGGALVQQGFAVLNHART